MDSDSIKAPLLSPVEQLLRREPSTEYVRSWETSLGREKRGEGSTPLHSLIVFRMAAELFALSSHVIGQITSMRPVHRLPHVQGNIVQGLVNINGRLRLLVSLFNMLDITHEASPRINQEKPDEMPLLVMERQGEVWTFAASEVLGVTQCDLTDIRNVPVTVVKSTVNYVKGLIPYRDKHVALLDDELLMFSLRRSL